MIKRITFSVLSVLGSICALSQPSSHKAQLLEIRRSKVYNHYQAADIAPILSGKIYDQHYSDAKNSPHFGGYDLELGAIQYQGITYRNILIQYDLYTQEIVIQLESKRDTQWVIADTNKVSEFNIKNYHFQHVISDSIMARGIYQLVYDGQRSKLFIKREMLKKEDITPREITVEFLPRNRFYIANDFGSFHVTSRKSLMRAFNNSSEISSILKKNGIRFSKNQIEQGLITVLSILDAEVANN